MSQEIADICTKEMAHKAAITVIDNDASEFHINESLAFLKRIRDFPTIA